MSAQKPSIARMVHYVSYGTPNGEYESACRAAVITGVPEPTTEDGQTTVFASLCVLNPTGMFFNQFVVHDEDKSPGTWHWPERVG